MSDPYRIVEVKPEWVIDREDMGTKTKFWYRDPDEDVNWLFKYPRQNTGEHWAEKTAAEVASALGVRHAKVELAQFEGDRGSATESFARGGRALHHGNQTGRPNPDDGLLYDRLDTALSRERFGHGDDRRPQ